MALPVVNFGKVTVSIGYDAAATSIVLSSGHGSKLPATTKVGYLLVWWNATDNTDPSDDPNVEIVKVTARAGDTLTVVRGQDGTAASTKNTGGKTYKMVLALVKGHYESLQSGKQTFRGLHFRSHPDADLAATRCMLVHAESVTFDEGDEISSGLDRLVLNTTTIGAGGMQAAAVNSTWNRAYIIRKRSDGTINLFGQRAKDYLLDEDVTAGEDGQFLLRDAAARTKLGNGFQVDNAGAIEIIDVKIAKVGAPTGTYSFMIQGDSAGLPNEGDIKATSDKYDVARLPTTSLLVRIPFRNPFSASALTQYHLTMQGDFAISGVNHALWRADTTAAAYTRGTKEAYDGATWTADATSDFIFKIYITLNDTVISLPTGYDQHCQIGWFYLDGSGNIKRFLALDRRVVTARGAAWKVGTAISATLALYDLSALLPPVPTISAHGGGSGVNNDLVVGPITGTDFAANADKDFSSEVIVLAGAASSPLARTSGVFLDQYQAAMALSVGSSVTWWIEEWTW